MENFPNNNELVGVQRRESYIKKNYPIFYKYLLENFPKDIAFKEKIYWYYNDIHDYPKCIECGKLLKFRDGSIGYGKFCSSKCSSNNENTIISKRNTRSLKTDDIKKKTLNTIIKKYGSLEEYNKYILNKTKTTNFKKYGVEFPLQSKEIRNKSISTIEKKYGCKCALLNDEVSKKSEKTNLDKYGTKHYTNREKSSHTRKINYINNHSDIIDIVNEDNKQYYICSCSNNECNKCRDKIFKIPSSIYGTRRYQHIEKCTILNPLGYDGSNTNIELFVENLLKNYNIKYIHNDRKILSKKELDFYIPSKNIAIECNGVFWHCDRNVDKNYHNSKFNSCQEKGIQLITIWEDQFKNHSDIVESIILSKLGIYDNRIYARKCIIREVSPKESQIFLTSNHLQGYTNSSVRLGLYYNDELVSIMTFGKLRKSLGNKSKESVYELYRFCNKLNTQVIGGASRLFQYFINKYNPSLVESFSSNDISDGNIYKKLNFIKDSTAVSYWYIEHKDLIRHHRYKFRKSELIKQGYDKNMSEFEIMNNMKDYYRIYDSGQTKWVWRGNMRNP